MTAPSPMIAQYQALKEQHVDCLLFFRMGDFYELFFEDAKRAAPALDIALTRRGRHQDEDIPMCGVPVHSAEVYLERLIRKGFKVAVCEQVEDPKAARQRGGKALVAREVVRVVTPGTLTEDSLLDARTNNYLAALAAGRRERALAWLDVSTGEVCAMALADGSLAAELARIEPGELLVAEDLVEDEPELVDWHDRLTPLAAGEFDSLVGERRLKAVYRVAELDGFGPLTRAEVGALGALLGYVERTQKGRLPHLGQPARVAPATHLTIDPATRQNLELVRNLAGERRGSLLDALDRTVTGAGARLLGARLAAPLADGRPIRRRLDAVEALVEDAGRRGRLRDLLKGAPDLERALSRLSLGRGGPRDLSAIRAGLARGRDVRSALDGATPALDDYARGLVDLDGLIERLAEALVDEPPLLARDGGFIRSDHAPELDRQRELRDRGRRLIVRLEQRLQQATAIPSLKIRHNNLLGYYIEVTQTHRAKVPADFVQRQSMATATRYSTAELAELESGIAQAFERARALELELFDGLAAEVLGAAEAIGRTAGALARLDVAAGLAELAVERNYARPEVDDGFDFLIEAGRHPVVEQALGRTGQPFIANDADLGAERRLWLMTGPNMAGKSTFLRQNALIALIAQIGSFVPAARARIGLIDRLFSRVGAADDLARGRSTFMVEMVETAAILNQATERSLVILDEIGRGTATYDGLSIAWAVVEHLHERVRCRALFATHYHELTALAARLDRLAVRTMRVKEWQGEVVFLHEVAEGAADRSYGIHVARLAGLPPAVLKRAEEVLHRLEQGEANRAPARLADDLPLFSAAASRAPEPPAGQASAPALDLLRGIRPDDLTPRDALELVYRLRALLDVAPD